MSKTFGKLMLGTVSGELPSSCAVKFDGLDVVPCTAVSDNCIGIVHNATNYTTGTHVVIDAGGYQVFIAEGAITAGDDLTLGTTTPGTLAVAASGNKVVGIAMHSAATGTPCDALIYTNKTTVKA